MATMPDQEMELELEGAGDGEWEYELEGDLEGDGEFEFELEGDLEGEWEGDQEGEYEGEWEGDLEGEEFFRRLRRGLGGIAKGVGSFVRKAAPALKGIAKVAAPMIGTAVGGPLGGILGNVAASALGEGELEYEGEEEGEFEGDTEAEMEAEPVRTAQQATAEMMAEVASLASTEAEAEAMAGAAAVASLSPRDRAALRRVLPHMTRGVAVLTRVLRKRRVTKPAVRAIPTIVRRTAKTLARRAAGGQPVSRKTAGRVMANQVKKVIGKPKACARAIRRNVLASRAAKKPAGRRTVTG